MESVGSSSMHQHGACQHTRSYRLSHAIAYTGSKPTRPIHDSSSTRTRGAHGLIKQGHIRTTRRETPRSCADHGLDIASILDQISPQSPLPLAGYGLGHGLMLAQSGLNRCSTIASPRHDRWLINAQGSFTNSKNRGSSATLDARARSRPNHRFDLDPISPQSPLPSTPLGPRSWFDLWLDWDSIIARSTPSHHKMIAHSCPWVVHRFMRNGQRIRSATMANSLGQPANLLGHTGQFAQQPISSATLANSHDHSSQFDRPHWPIRSANDPCTRP